jgi:hypothetical protein
MKGVVGVLPMRYELTRLGFVLQFETTAEMDWGNST